MPKYKTLAEMYLAGSGLCVMPDGGKFGLWNRKTKAFISADRWTDRKSAENYLAVSVMFSAKAT